MLKQTTYLKENQPGPLVLSLYGQAIPVAIRLTRAPGGSISAVDLIDLTDKTILTRLSIPAPESTELPANAFFLNNWGACFHLAAQLRVQGIVEMENPPLRMKYVHSTVFAHHLTAYGHRFVIR